MFGFIEQWLADILELDYEPHQLNNGGMAAIVDRDTFSRVKSALTALWREEEDPPELQPVSISADIAGMKVMIHKYWANEEILHGLTGGEAKDLPQYIAFLNLGTNRFQAETFRNKIRSWYFEHRPYAERNEEDGAEEGNEIEAEAVAEAETAPMEVSEGALESDAEEVKPKEEDKLPDEETDLLKPSRNKDREDFLNFFRERFDGTGRFQEHNVGHEDLKVILFGYENTPNIEEIKEMSVSINRNIIVCSDTSYSNIKNDILKNQNPNKIQKHTIIFLTEPNNNPDISMPEAADNPHTMCMGSPLKGLRIVQGDLNKEIELIKKDRYLTQEEKDYRIDSINNKPNMSAYARYDAIFKDTMTGIVWAIKDRCFLYLLFRPKENRALFETCVKELSRRFDGKLSMSDIRQIDKEYYASISEHNKENYVKFALESAKSVLDKLKDLHKKADEDYKKAFNEAMEYGKLAQRFLEQIHGFEKGSYVEEESAKAMKAYQETMDIPEVLSINVTNETINVYTKNLYAQDERTKKWHDIGTFHIMIGMGSNKYNTEATVKIMNTKHQVVGFSSSKMQAPHVFNDGHICHGTLAQGMIEAYKRRNLFELVYQVILFLQTANTDDAAGAKISSWPEVPEEIALSSAEVEDELVIHEPSEAEKKFDDMLADSIPVHI